MSSNSPWLLNEPNILFLNQHLVAVDKPEGWLSVPSRFSHKDPRPVVGVWLQKTLGITIYPVHRLDEEVSGLMIFATNPDSQKLLSRLWSEHQMKKIYHALSEATNPPVTTDGTWESLLLRGKKRAYEKPWGKKSVTHWRWLGTYHIEMITNPIFVWELSPLTGRPHQLRYQMARHGYPIWGDSLYGSKQNWPSPGIALRSIALYGPPNLLQERLQAPFPFFVPSFTFFPKK
ncbi:MAG: RluA family pseudouridine synthase [Bdellovibrionaceae bacterium]|nr:RluA family pseudouridine synthase [Pseudobdellovibrionaceae bacterium]MDW8189508.1 RluA family pseudouridine synthase [Pseudobdellovibrionaceae bacterium]